MRTWTLEPVKDKKTKVLASKWVYDIKTDNEDFVTRFKARLVAKGCAQKAGVHYDETFWPVTNFGTIRILFAVAVLTACFVDILDVKTAYLNAFLAGVYIFMHQPKGFERNGPNGE